MKQKWKRILSIFMSVCMMFTTIPTTAFAEEMFVEDIGMIVEDSEYSENLIISDSTEMVEEQDDAWSDSGEIIIEDLELIPEEGGLGENEISTESVTVPEETEAAATEAATETPATEAAVETENTDEELLLIEDIELSVEELPEELLDDAENEAEAADGTILGIEVSKPEQGDGTSENPYVLTSREELYWFTGLVNGHEAVVTDTLLQNTAASAVLGGDITVNTGTVNAESMDVISWMSIGTVYNGVTNSYTGTFDGAGYTISGLYFNDHDLTSGTGTYGGLFGNTGSGCVIQNLGLENSYFSADAYTGGIVGYAAGTTITACYSTAVISGGKNSVNAGGIAGYFEGTMSAAFSAGIVSADAGLEGGICGATAGDGFTDVYFLKDTAAAASGSGAVTGVTEAEADQFASGEVAYAMNGSTSSGVWYQTLGESGDAYPALDDSHGVVYRTIDLDCEGNEYMISGYNNEADSTSSKIHHVSYAHGLCAECGDVDPSIVKQPEQDEDGTYLISCKEELYWFAGFVEYDSEINPYSAGTAEPKAYTANAKLTADIVVNEGTITESSKSDENVLYWRPMGYYGGDSGSYQGTFDGNGHTISGLYITSDYNTYRWAVGFVSLLKLGGCIKNLGIVNSYVSGDQYIGAIAGSGADEESLIENCYSDASVEANEQAGGIIGRGWDLTIRGCYNTGSVTAHSGVGGINGTHHGAVMEKCYNAGTITCDATSAYSAYLGGLAGIDYADSVIKNCFNTGTVQYTGSGSSLYMGGITSTCYGTMINVFNCGELVRSGDLPSNRLVGGVAGKIDAANATVKNAYNNSDFISTGAASGDDLVTATTTDELATGIIAFLMNEDYGDSPVWYQTLGEDGYPVLDSSHGIVYATATRDCPGMEYTVTGLNNSSGTISDGAHEYDDHEQCVYCLRYNPEIAPELVDGVYQINNENQLYWYAGLVSGWASVCYGDTVKNASAKAILMADIEMNGGSVTSESTDVRKWSPIMNFSGSFDGNGHTISGLYATQTYYSGFFYSINEGGSVSDLQIKDSYVYTTKYGGGIAAYNYGTITGCSFEGTIATSSGDVGGIAGINEGTITNCWFRGTITGEDSSCIGGLTGCMKSGTLSSCYAYAVMTASENAEGAGGIAGSYAAGTVTNCCYLASNGLNAAGTGTLELDAAKTEEQFASGEAAYLLNGNSSSTVTWYQTIGTDTLPVMDNTHGTVYISANENCAGKVMSVVGYNNTGYEVVSTADHVYGEDNICTVCGRYNPDLLPKLVDGVYQISTALELQLFAYLVNGDDRVCDDSLPQNRNANAVLTADIVMNEGTITAESADADNWTPIGKSSYYGGTFDGNGYSISGIYCVNSSTNGYAGLFGSLKGAVGNLTVKNSYFEGQRYVGAIAAEQYSSSARIYSCTNEAAVVLKENTISSYTNYAGGIVGYGYYVYDCLNKGTVSTDVTGTVNYLGGICGACVYTMSRCLNLGTITVPEGSSTVYGAVAGQMGSSNSYCCYLETSCDQFCGTGSQGTNSGSVTADQLKSGEITYRLNRYSSADPIWYQTLDSDDAPVLDGSHGIVYATGYYPCPGTALVTDGYSNSEPVYEVGEHSYTENEYYCDYCGMWTEPDQAADGYYEISNIGELYWFAEYVQGNSYYGIESHPSANARLVADIKDNAEIEHFGDWDNMTEEEGSALWYWWPIGGCGDVSYSGIFDGNGHTISQLYCSESSYVGLFGSLSGAAVKNLSLEDCYFAGSSIVGSIAGAANEAVIVNCSTNGGEVYAYGSTFAGGLVGMAEYTTIQNCHNGAEVYASGCEYVGGISGGSNLTKIEYCYNTSPVTGTGYVGGITGLANEALPSSDTESEVPTMVIRYSYNYGAVTGNSEVGGIAGYVSDGVTTEDCYYLDTAAGTAFGIEDSGEVCAVSEEDTVEGPSKYGTDGEILYARSAEAFASGEVTFLLNDLKSDSSVVWKQQLGTDQYPVLTGSYIVYPTGERDCSGQFLSFTGYTNSSEEWAAAPDHEYENGICVNCGQLDETIVPSKDSNGVYQIGNAAELYSFAAIVNGTHTAVAQDTDANAVLTADIVVNELYDENGNVVQDSSDLLIWTPIGDGWYDEELYQTTVYEGIFDGQGHFVQGLLAYEETELPLGLFGFADNAVIRNVSVTGSWLSGGYEYVGGIAGSIYGTKISGCSVCDTVLQGKSRVGGIVGDAAYADILNCSFDGEVDGTGEAYIGGILGYGSECTVYGCYNEGSVYAYNSENVGGIAGYCNNYDTFWTNCYNVGEIHGDSYVGGLLGYGQVSVFNSYNYGTVSGNTDSNVGLGSLVGMFDDSSEQLINCYYLTGMEPIGMPAEQLSETVENETSVPTPDYTGNPVEKTAEQFASGEVAFLLNEARMENVAWYQTIGTDYPTFAAGDVVYAKGTTDCAGNLLTFDGFTNSESEKASGDGHVFENGVCSNCGWLEYVSIPKKDTNGVYQIGTSAELYGFSAIVNGLYASAGYDPYASAVLTDDIVVNENVLNADMTLAGTAEDYLEWIPIGADINSDTGAFGGTFDGQGHTISGLYLEMENGCSIGLFGILDGAVVKNVILADSYLNMTGSGVAGAIAGYAYNGSKISSCTNESYIGGSEYTGGIAAALCKTSSIEKCHNAGTVCGKSGTAGGITAYIQNEIMEQSLLNETTETADGTLAVSNCYNTGTVTGGYYAGGIVGEYGGTERYIMNCFNTGFVKSEGYEYGAVCGYANADRIYNCYYNQDVAGSENIEDSECCIGMTTEEIASGELAYWLNDEMPEVWYQNIGSDAVPVLDSSHGTVYAGYQNCGENTWGYGNVPLYEEKPDHVCDAEDSVILSEASCEATGTVWKKCSVCLETFTEEIPATGHLFAETEDALKSVEPDDAAGTNGMTYWECQNEGCEEIKVNAILPCSSVETAMEVLSSDSEASAAEKVSALTEADNQALLDYDAETVVEAVKALDTVLVESGVQAGTDDTAVTVNVGNNTYTAADDVTELSIADVTVEGAAVTVAAAVMQGIENDTAAEGDTYSAQIALSEESTGTDTETGNAYYQVDISLNIVKTSTDESGTETTTVVSEKQQLEAPIIITIPIPACYQGMDFDLYHLVENEDGSVTRVQISYTLNEENQTITFVTPSLSFYVFGNGCCKNHNLVLDENASAAATCTEPGKWIYRCSTAYCDYAEQKLEMATGHTMGEWSESKAATCMAQGEESRSCTNVNCQYTETRKTDKLGYHTYENTYTVDKEATCASEGQRSIHCSAEGCTAVKEGSVQSIPKEEHTWGSGKVQNAATCQVKGVMLYTCTADGCGATKTEVIPTAVHTPGTSWTVTVPATCKASGTQVQYCTVCKEITATKAIDKLSVHNWGDWVETKAATAVANGEETRTCKTCGSSVKETRATDKLDGFIKLNVTSIPLAFKQSTTKIKVTEMQEGDSVVSWESSNTKIVKVNSNGKITAQSKAGKAVITVTLASGTTGTITVTVQKKAVATTKITGLSSKVTLKKGEKLTLKPILQPITSVEKIKYTSSRKKVATVSAKGVITAKAAGKTKITVKAGKKKFVATVTVQKTATESITNVKDAVTIKKGKSLTLKPKLNPANSEEKIIYKSNNTKVAVVNAKGKITAKKKGTAVITVKSGKVSVKCKVTVK